MLEDREKKLYIQLPERERWHEVHAGASCRIVDITVKDRMRMPTYAWFIEFQCLVHASNNSKQRYGTWLKLAKTWAAMPRLQVHLVSA